MLALDPEYLSEVQDDNHQEPEQRLWVNALVLLLDDAQRFQSGQKINVYNQYKEYEGESAYDDVMRCGPMLRYLCSNTGDNPNYLSSRFRQMTRKKVA